MICKGISVVEPIAQDLADSVTREMGKVAAEAKEEVDAANDLQGSWLNMVLEANTDVSLPAEDGSSESVIVPQSMDTRISCQ